MQSVVFLVLGIAIAAAENCTLPAYLGSFKHKQAAFLDVLPNGQGGNDLFISAFSGAPFTKGSVARVENIEIALKRDVTLIQPTMMHGRVTWPNGVKLIDADVKIEGAPSKHRAISCGGFLVPSHGDGRCHVYNMDEETGEVSILEIARSGRGKFFHQAAFYDVDNDGLHDLVAPKAWKPIIGGAGGALYWFKNPGTASNGLWKEQLMFNGPDVHFTFKDLDADNVPEIIATEFFSKKLTISWLKAGAAFADGPKAWETKIIADDLGELFNMTMIDINKDGKEDIVLTNHVTDRDLAGVYAFEIPSDFKNGEYKRHTLVTDFPTLNGGIGQASPGGVVHVPMKDGSMVFALAGDGNQKAYIVCESNGAWHKTQLLDTKNTVGAIAVSDVTGDGHAELFVPSYEKGEVHVYSYGI